MGCSRVIPWIQHEQIQGYGSQSGYSDHKFKGLSTRTELDDLVVRIKVGTRFSDITMFDWKIWITYRCPI